MRSTWRCRDGLCVIGDAAGTVNPITGHGLTLACHDALQLASAIAESAGSGRRDVPCVDDIPHEHDHYRRAVEDFSDMLVNACFEHPDAGTYSELAAAFGAVPKLSLLLEGAPLLERFRRIQQQLSFNTGQNHLSDAQGSENASSKARRGR
jgi:2-polyprenyl-6-methoxyphenol hydroxylase-like FAD-dependent oxidoreductase